MLLALDVGNTNIVIGFLDESGIRNIARLETDRDKTAHEYAISLRQVIEFSGIAPENIDGAILSSVVPPINGALIAAVRMITGIRPLVVGPGMKTGLNIALDNPAAMGSDLVVGAAAALAIHAPPLIIIDMGTATTMTVIDREARVLGGAIIPGVGISLEALANGTSQLPHISLDAPKKCISSDTVEAMRSGSVYGTAAMLDGMIERMEAELEWVRSSPKARQAKNKARLARYEEMEAEARASQKLDWTDIRIPVGPRLGNKVLEAHHLHKEFDGRVLIDDLSFTLPRNGIVGVIGPNGVGKTTLFKTIVGLEPLTSGELEVGETVKISYVDQNRSGIDPDKNLWEVVSDGLDHMMVGETEVPSRAYVASFGFKGQDQQKRAGVLSGGERNRLNLALTLKQGGNLLLLDEPTNDLDVETLSSLEAALLEFPGCSVVISHDRMFLDRVATHILAWEGTDENPGNWYWFEGNFEAYQANRIERLGEDAAQPHRIHRKLTRD